MSNGRWGSKKKRKPLKKLKLSRLFRDWYGMQDTGLNDMIAIWRERGESEEEINRAKQDLADLFNGTWISVKKSNAS